jgi:hypothetical protein
VGLFRLEVGVADIAVAVADEVVHQRRHLPGRPGIGLVQAGRTYLAGQAELDVQAGVGGIAGERGEIPVVVAARTVAGVEGVGVAEMVAAAVGGRVVAADVAGIHADAFVADAEQGRPLRVRMALPFAEQGRAVAFAVIDVDEGARPHAAAGSGPPVVEAIALELAADAQQVVLAEAMSAFRLKPLVLLSVYIGMPWAQVHSWHRRRPGRWRRRRRTLRRTTSACRRRSP